MAKNGNLGALLLLGLGFYLFSQKGDRNGNGNGGVPYYYPIQPQYVFYDVTPEETIDTETVGDNGKKEAGFYSRQRGVSTGASYPISVGSGQVATHKVEMDILGTVRSLEDLTNPKMKFQAGLR